MQKKNISAKPMEEKPGVEYSDTELMQQAQVVANSFARAFNRKHGTKIPVPVSIDWDLHLKKPKTAGVAMFTGGIGLNLILMREYPHEVLNRTVPHEIAHLAEFDEDRRMKRKTGDHGPVWVKFMQSMAQPVLRYHGMNTKAAVAASKLAKKVKK
jgi:predicted SprT family Zn-dependent metalloprotease